MNYAIDVVYLDADFQIVAIDEMVAPRKFSKIYKNAVSVVELPAGKVADTKTKVGHYFKKTERGEM